MTKRIWIKQHLVRTISQIQYGGSQLKFVIFLLSLYKNKIASPFSFLKIYHVICWIRCSYILNFCQVLIIFSSRHAELFANYCQAADPHVFTFAMSLKAVV